MQEGEFVAVEDEMSRAELYKLQNQLLSPILNIIDSVIRKIGEERSYDYIFDAVQGSIVYALDSHNLTQDILDELKEININDELKKN